jgi:ferric-dicitrate binding protein FerR (iron transport regulator)
MVETPLGEKSKVLLPDGSEVWLNAGSRLYYGNNFNRRNREVTLSGEAYFEVAKQTQHPFTVKTKEYDVEVKGTKFNVSSYDNEQFSTTTLMEGSIVLRHFNKEYLLKPGEQMQVDIATHRLYLRSANAQQYKSWTEGRIEYDSISLNELFNRIAREYNLQVHISKDVNTSLILNVSLNNQETPGEILYGLSKITPFKFRYNKTDIYISK